MTFSLTRNVKPIPILVYHQIDSAPPRGQKFRSLYVAPKAFARQMALLDLLGYQGLSMSALTPYLLGEKSGKVVGLTFDDGYLNNLTHALPVLQKFGFSSTCYVVSSLAGQTNSWDAGMGVAQTRLMTYAEMKQWIAAGQEIGCHTQNHADLTAVTDDVAEIEVVAGTHDLEETLQTPVKHFCYPFGKYEPKHVQIVAASGYTTATTTVRGRCHAGSNMLELPRVPVVKSTTLPVLLLKLASRYEEQRGP
jgi:peptidoglycan/xylan/chitin deacetylase (PgdA/CDA1 family)